MYARDVESALRAAGENPYWRQPDAELALSLWQDSGQSLSAFGRPFGISVQKLRRWRRRLVFGKKSVTVRGTTCCQS